MTKSERLKELIERVNKLNDGRNDAIDVAIQLFRTDDGRELLHMARTELEWNWQDWLHHEGEYAYHEFSPAQHIRDQVADDWKLRRIYCTKCKGYDNCGKYNNKHYLAGIEQKRYGGKLDPKQEQAINYLVWRPCKYNNIDKMTLHAAAATNGRSDYL